MDSVQLRLEIVRLVYKAHEKPENAIETAKVLEAYVAGEAKPVQLNPQKGQQHQANKGR